MNKRTLVIYSTIVIVFSGLLYWFLIYPLNNLSGEYKNQIYDQIVSPDQKFKVVLFEGNSGATDGFVTRVSILKNEEKLNVNDLGNILIADNNHGNAPSGLTGGSPVRISWIDNHSLSIEVHPLARIFKKVTEYEGINIQFIENKNIN